MNKRKPFVFVGTVDSIYSLVIPVHYFDIVDSFPKHSRPYYIMINLNPINGKNSNEMY